MTRALRAESIHFAYEGRDDVLKNVSAAVRAGCMTGIAGPNGSGKSTLLRLLCGLLRPRTGGVTLDGKPLATYSGRERARRLAFLPQSVSPAFAVTCYEAVCLGRYPRAGAFGALESRDFEAALRCMRDTETEHLKHRSFMSLSGGERQRVLLAGILAQEPDLLLLDEPTAALDIHHEAEVFSLLKRLVKDGYGIAVVTHDLNLAAQFCDELILLSTEHEVAAFGPPVEVLEEGLLSSAYGAAIRVGVHPFHGTPFVAAQRPEDAS